MIKVEIKTASVCGSDVMIALEDMRRGIRQRTADLETEATVTLRAYPGEGIRVEVHAEDAATEAALRARIG